MGKRVKRGSAKSFKQPKWMRNTLKSVGRELKAKAKKPAPKIKLGHDTPSKADAMVTRIEKLEYPKGLPPRPAGTRWPKEINIGKRHRKEFGDIEALALSYNERGAIIQPIAITGDNDLIAGERRLKAWVHPKSNFVAKPIPVHVISIDSIVAGEWDENAHRKDFTPSEAVSIKREIEVLLKKHAKDRQRAHGGTTHGRKSTATDKLNVGERAAAMTGKKRRTLEKAEKIEDAAERDPKRFGKLRDDMNRTGRVDGPFKRLQVMQQTDALRNAPSPLPMRGPYMALSIDYPWPAERDAEQADIDKRGRSMRDYPEMAIATGEKLFKSKEFRALLAPAHTVYFWTTNFHMEDAFVLLNAMGFEKHSTIGTWVKNKMGRGQVLRGQTEHCIIATRGKPTINLTTQTTRWEGEGWEVREDSRKPDAFYALVEELTPAPRYAEIFSRGGRNEKWDCHGDQAGKFAPSIAKEVQAEILKEITRTPDELKLATLEAVEKGETPDLRLLDKALLDKLDRCVTGKKKLKLTEQGKVELGILRADAADKTKFATLPADLPSLTALFLRAAAEFSDAIMRGDHAGVSRIAQMLAALQMKANGGNSQGVASDDSPAEDLRRASRALIGVVPHWGQRGSFPLDVDGVPYWIRFEPLYECVPGFEIYAIDPDKPFASDSGFRNFMLPWIDGDVGQDELAGLPVGRTVEQHCLAEIREYLATEEMPNGTRRPRKKVLPTPEKVHSAPTEWRAGPSYNAGQPKEISAKAARKAIKTSVAPAVIKSQPKSARRTLPGRDAKLISFAESQGHIVSMTLSVDGEESIGSCECGFEHREPRHGIPGDTSDPWIVEKRMASSAAMDAAITDHWRIQKGLKPVLQPTADEPAAEPDGEDKVAAAAVLPAGTDDDDNQLDIPGFLKRQHA